MSGEKMKAGGAGEYLKGKLQRALGRLTGKRSLQAKGLGSQAKGAAKYESGNIEGKIEDL